MQLNIPIMGQLLDATEVNRYWDCVPTSIASALQFLTGQPFDGGQIKDTIYGASYVGATAARDYIDYCRRFGIKLFAINGDGNGATLVNASIGQLAMGNPVLYTEPDPYDDPNIYSHVVLACGYDDTNVYVMDPYVAQILTKSRAEWARILEFNQVWPLARIGIQWMEAFIGEHANDTRVQLWESFALSMGHIPPRQGTGFFNDWVGQLNKGINKGSPFGPEYKLTLASGRVVAAQNFPGGTVVWDDTSSTATWL